ncbi:hypothetical protein B0T14DRAFT_490510 [Immersiella caudata]|uniref:Uncharacterized protein n=1 Tax=Immersiella caudata TaxID=314043 RepID=A0AA40CBF4_9PEZI|nr:hypothetical protein B0T14DRAFT_490510 [Immersiella caudata]
MLEALSPPDNGPWPAIAHRNDLYPSEGPKPTFANEISNRPSDVANPSSHVPIKPTLPRHQSKGPGPNLLDLPLEIRLQIYSWVHLLHPLAQPDLSPWYPVPSHTAYFLVPIMAPIFWRSNEDSHSSTTYLPTTPPDQPSPKLLSPYRPQSYLPTSLLLASHQIYIESRTLPFRNSEFVFVTWFSSGLSAARALVKGLRPWQRDAMRFARIELQIRDLGDVTRLAAWEELCGYWKEGMRGLRIKVDLEDGDVQGKGRGEWWMLGREWAPKTWSGERHQWVAGLGGMRRLRAVEVEIVGRKMDDVERVEWCADLGRRLNGTVRVVCVRKVEQSFGT